MAPALVVVQSMRVPMVMFSVFSVQFVTVLLE